MKKTWKWIIAAVIVLAAAALAVAVVLDHRADRRSTAKEYEHSITYFYSDEEGATRFLVDSALLDNKIAGAVDSFLSCDGSVGLARAGTGLYRVDKDGIKLVYPAGVDRALLSPDNAQAVFTTATQVHIYDERTGELEDVKPEGIYGVASICLSPGGKTVGYSVKAKDGRFYSYAHENGSSRLIASDAYLLAIGDGADFFYYVQPDDVSLWYSSGRRPKKIGSDISSYLEFNRDLTEVIFDMNGVTYYSVNGSPAKTLIKDSSVYTTVAECESHQGGESFDVAVKDCSSLFGCVFYSFKDSSTDSSARTIFDLWYVDARMGVTELVKGATQFFITDDDRSLSCLVNKDVYFMDVRDPSTRERVCTNTYSYNMTGDGQKYFCVGYDLSLYSVTPRSQPVRIDSNVLYSTLTVDGRCLYLADASSGVGVLRSVKDPDVKITVSGGVRHMETMPRLCCYYTDYYRDEYGKTVYDVFTSEDGVSFTKTVTAVPVNTDASSDGN